MEALKAIILLIGSYLYGNILFAIPITKIFTGQDIRKIGNTNPGTSNTFKNVGVFPGILVFLLDSSKSIVPMVIAKNILYSNQIPDNGWFFLTFIGLVAILGHTRPFWNHFKKGGGGMGTAIGMYAFLIPVEYGIAFIISIGITYIFMRDANYKMGRWVTLYAAVLAPILAVLTNLWFNIPLFSHFEIGDHPFQVLFSPVLIILLLLVLNSKELFFWIKNPESKVNPR